MSDRDPAENARVEATVDRLAERLRVNIEHLDPTREGDQKWAGLTDHQKEFYRCCIEWILQAEADIHAALGLPTTTS